ncbi:ribokinase [Sunxiuqinia elliptica]|uniref:Ribokinase n=1 Tax=Sunxiuqinia elliptica TaxID=655355 RepID=A0A4V3BXT4_9BACT|nr:ribokinase [Sunxiuqinia elliptica]TDO00079.1 ribokinase [Sunxiuqinia elliptica]TDO57270.1 ribokinase [Sunxiuqinia elliptica]
MKKILVVGSSNTDMVIKTRKFPAPGETILGGRFFMNPGGKGANQAVAARRLGGIVSFVGKIGNDIFGKQAMQLLEDEGIRIDFVATDSDHPSGVAMITVDAEGENSIVVAPGSNGTLSPKDVDQATTELNDADLVLLQLETPLDTVAYIAEKANSLGKKVVLNPAPAPASPLPDALYKNLFIITPNETEAELLTGIRATDESSAQLAAEALRAKGVDIVIITMGASGAFLLSPTHSEMIPAPVVKAVDTTAAGDTFNGALVVAISEGLELPEAVRFASQAASLSVTKIGAQSSIPYRKEVETTDFH